MRGHRVATLPCPRCGSRIEQLQPAEPDGLFRGLFNLCVFYSVAALAYFIAYSIFFTP